jgi:phosphorylcholine metabolism protein LicD
MMPRVDYLKFIEQFCLKTHGSFELVSIQNNKLYFAPFAKIFDNQTIMFQEYGQVEKVVLLGF